MKTTNKKITDTSLLESGCAYKVNGRKKLYWDGSRFLAPSRIKGYLQIIPEQPEFKYAIKIVFS